MDFGALLVDGLSNAEIAARLNAPLAEIVRVQSVRAPRAR
jgi:hypothetical protein